MKFRNLNKRERTRRTGCVNKKEKDRDKEENNLNG